MCDVFSETTFTLCTVGPDQGGARSATCVQKQPLPGGPQGRIKVDHGVRDVSGNHPYPVLPRAGSRWTTECDVSSTLLGNKIRGTQFVPGCSRICSRALASGTKNVPDNALEHWGFCVFLRFREHFFPERSPRVPDFVPDNLPLEQKLFPIAGAPQGRIKVDHGVRDVPGNPPLPMPHRAGSRRTTDCDMYLARTLTPCPVGLEQGAPRSARSTRKPFFPGAPYGRSREEDHGVRDVSGNRPYQEPRRAGSRWTRECKMYPETTVTRGPAGPEQGGTRCARCYRKPLLPGVP